jgi:tryptophan halogenase
VYFGQRVMPRGYDSLADGLDSGELARRLQAVREQVGTAAARMPGHEDFLSQYCPAEPPKAAGGMS